MRRRFNGWKCTTASAWAWSDAGSKLRVASDESQRHITWEIRAGGQDGDDRLVCESAQAQPACALTASTTDRPELTTVHLYLHGATLPAAYEGSRRLPFLQGAEKVERPVKVNVEPGAAPHSLAVTGLVTSKSATYTMAVSLTVKQGTKEVSPIARDVKVVVQ